VPPQEHRKEPEVPASVKPRAFRILGVLGKLYVLMENESGLVLVDQHAAHERVLFEELRRRLETSGIPGQRLLISPTIQLPPKDFDWVKAHLEELATMGISLEEFGPNTFKIDSLPEYLIGEDPAQLMRDLIDELRSMVSETKRVRLGEDMIATTVCRHAVKAHDVLKDAELVKLIEDLLACELPYCCPHGRPTMIQISYAELEKKFGRKV
jgi:DNA mismatch repair protein MutL